MVSTIREQIQADCDAVAEQVKEFKATAHELTECQRKMHSALDQLQSSLRFIQSKPFIYNHRVVMDKTYNLEDSISQLRLNLNQMDFGTFVVRSDRAMEATWEAVP